MIEVIPNPLLIEYLKLSNTLKSELHQSTEQFQKNGEWHYIESNIEYNILLLERLIENDLLRNKTTKICDLGIGLGTIMFDLYLQSQCIKDYKFEFYGIEKHKPYIDAINTNLNHLWQNNITIHHDDILNHTLNQYNFFWVFTPFTTADKLMTLFEKIIDEMPINSIVIGIDHFRITNYGNQRLIEKFKQLDFSRIDELGVFTKTQQLV